MKSPHPLQLLTLGLAALILFSTVTAIATTNTVPPSRLDQTTLFIGINDYKPSACAGYYLTNLVTGTGALTGTEGNDLIIGSADVDTIDALGGNDCILGGGGDDMITGGDGNDICMGGPGTDVFTTCEGENQ